MFDPESAALLQGSGALIVGTVDADGAPLAARGWGCRIVDGQGSLLRLLIGANDPATLENLRTTGVVAVTAADVPTLRSIQLKGRVVAIEPASEADEADACRHIEALFDDIEATDGADRSVLRRWVAGAYVACTVEVDDRFDQTPGPEAGAPLPGASR